MLSRSESRLQPLLREELFRPSLKFWADKFNYESDISFSPYGQVFQQLIDKKSVLNDPQANARVVCLRIEDWLRDLSVSDDEEIHNYLTDNVDAFCNYVKEAKGYSSAPLFIFITENSPVSNITGEMQAGFENRIKASLSNENNVFVSTSEDIRKQYPVDNYYDEQRDTLGHIPFTEEYFVALGTTVFRKIQAQQRSPFKVIVLDCDNTLWGGVCGESGPEGIILSEPFRYLQSFMLDQKDSGKILCLCSKNVQEDVDKVFSGRKDMVLTEKDIVASKINWQPKSTNIKELSEELSLGLDSFIFIDDNPVECAEVRSQCPGVMTLNLPENPEEIPSFLDHVWAFDQLTTTSEDKSRTKLYQENIRRSGFKSSTSSMKDFIAGLNLEVEIREPDEEEISRVSQLTYRTNQFNFTTIRRSEKEIKDLMESGYSCKICRVKDRFGDYGLVGVLIFTIREEYLELDSLMLSCRVLGRGVEHKMLQSLAREAKNKDLSSVKINFESTKKNLPAGKFLESVKNGEDSLQFSTDYLINLEYDPVDHDQEGEQVKSDPLTEVSRDESITNNDTLVELIGKELNSALSILNEIRPNKNGRDHLSKGTGKMSDAEVEKLITEIWEDVLGSNGIRSDQHFFDVGGTSLKAVEVLSGLNETFSKNLTVVSLFEHSTIQSLVELVQDRPSSNDGLNKILDRAVTRRERFRARR
ncbi:MAG: HAD-IIIC family phosphatase [Gracilimonas sp.]|nr:HAD-IIIC family phosphatase [Gracilimonas sp.]